MVGRCLGLLVTLFLLSAAGPAALAAPVAPGAPTETVFAAGPGVVAFAGTVAGTGTVSIDHAGGLRTTYEPLTATVHKGQPVVAGQPIGTLAPGHPGCPVAACLHWGLRRGTE